MEVLLDQGRLMIKIGDFSSLAHVSIKTLHHYDELGLLNPAHVDRYNGYRYYTLDQLTQLNRILALKELGFSLEQVSRLLNENLSTAEMRGMLRMKRMELESNVQEETARLTRIENRLRQLEMDGSPNIGEIAIKEIPSLSVLSAKAIAASEDALIPAKKSLINLLQDHLNRLRTKPISPWFSIMDNLPYDENNLEIELAVGINPISSLRSDDWGTGPVRFKTLKPVAKMACVIHKGPYETIIQAYTALFGWTKSNAYEVTGSCREIYLPQSGTITIPENLDTFTEVQCPVKPTSIPVSIYSPNERKEKTMEPKIVTKSAFKAVGLSYIGKNEAGEIPKMWDVFNERFLEFNNIDQTCCYGLCFSTPVEDKKLESLEPGVFEYVAGVEVADDQEIPKGMVYREVPENQYLVFTHHGKLDKLGETYKYIYETWIPQSNHKVHPSKFDMEVYTDEFIMDSDESKFYIYVAIEE